MLFRDRVIGCFQGLATGDAIGKQTETLAHEAVRKWYPEGISGFHGKPGETIPRYAGTRYVWRIGETTDDTEQTVAVAKAVLETGRAEHEAIGRELLRCTKSLHPGVRLWTLHQSGDPAHIATEGDGCGAAMRVAPIGVMYRPWQMEELVRGAWECAIPTHGGQWAIGGAAAVAAAVSAALEGWPAGKVLTAALEASRLATTETRMAERIAYVHEDLAGRTRLDVEEIAGTHLAENVVPLAIGLALVSGSAEATALIAANLGGDADSVASIGGAIAGALWPGSVNAEWVRMVSGGEVWEVAVAMARRWPRE